MSCHAAMRMDSSAVADQLLLPSVHGKLKQWGSDSTAQAECQDVQVVLIVLSCVEESKKSLTANIHNYISSLLA